MMSMPFGALAYIGPGMGVGVGAVILGVVVAFFLAIFAVLWFPIKTVINKVRKKAHQTEKDDSTNTFEESPDKDSQSPS